MLANGKLVIIDGDTVETSTSVIVVDISRIDFIKFDSNGVVIEMSSGKPLTLTGLTYFQISQFSEFLNTLISLNENSSIKKIIKINQD